MAVKKPLVLDDEGNIEQLQSGDSIGGNSDFSGAISLTSIISPPTITSNVNNYQPTGLGTCNVIRISIDANRTITGIMAQSNGRYIYIFNSSNNDTLKILHDSTLSNAANRILCPNNADVSINKNDGRTIWYDVISSRWRLK